MLQANLLKKVQLPKIKCLKIKTVTLKIYKPIKWKKFAESK